MVHENRKEIGRNYIWSSDIIVFISIKIESIYIWKKKLQSN